MNNIVFWRYTCPKCGKVIDDSEIMLPFGGSILATWNPKNYYGDYLHFHCSKCKAHLAFNWMTPVFKILACQFAYLLLVLVIYNSSPLKNSYDTTPVYSALSAGCIVILMIGYIVYSRSAKLEIIADDPKARKMMEKLEADKILNGEKDFGENEAVRYDLGHPDLNDMKDGILEINHGNLLFKEQYKDKVYFTIPLKEIGEVKTSWKLLSSSIYNGMAAMGGERNYLFVKFRKDGLEYRAEFANPSYNMTSTILERLKYKILNAKNKLDKEDGG